MNKHTKTNYVYINKMLKTRMQIKNNKQQINKTKQI